MDSRIKLSDKLAPFLPEEALPIVCEWIVNEQATIKITRSRTSKHGDYSSPGRGKGHFITINHDLNKYEFLITLVHEFAHMRTHKKHSGIFKFRRVSPHGKEWKQEFGQMLAQVIAHNLLPNDLRNAVEKYAMNPKASSCSDLDLQRALIKYRDPSKITKMLEELPEDSHFRLTNNRIFKKGKRLRKNYRCIELSTNRLYLVSPVAIVERVEPSR